MKSLPEQSTRGWSIGLDQPPTALTDDATAALTRATEKIANARSRAPRAEEGDEVAAALTSAVLSGANEHQIATATGLTLHDVRALLLKPSPGRTQ